MAGSVYHLIGNRQKELALPVGVFGASYSNLPKIMSAIKFASEHNALWTDGIDGTSDYLSVLEFMQEKFLNQLRAKELADDFPEQNLQFVARVLKLLPQPSEQEIQKIVANSNMDRRGKQMIKQTLLASRGILICSPLYVALADKQYQVESLNISSSSL